MRVIAGSAKHMPLKTVPGEDTRPTTDRIKETLFNMIQNDIYGCKFLDLFSGSGAIGIEALSRGAKEAVFVEHNRKAAECIKENLCFTKLSDRGNLLVTDAKSAVKKLQGSGAFDMIFMDPPYDQLLEKELLTELIQTDLVDEDTLLIVEASLKTSFDYLNELGYQMKKYKKYKTNAHIFIEKLRCEK